MVKSQRAGRCSTFNWPAALPALPKPARRRGQVQLPGWLAGRLVLAESVDLLTCRGQWLLCRLLGSHEEGGSTCPAPWRRQCASRAASRSLHTQPAQHEAQRR